MWLIIIIVIIIVGLLFNLRRVAVGLLYTEGFLYTSYCLLFSSFKVTLRKFTLVVKTYLKLNVRFHDIIYRKLSAKYNN